MTLNFIKIRDYLFLGHFGPYRDGLLMFGSHTPL